jgi:quercetin dioxygenase-like cupin family protein
MKVERLPWGPHDWLSRPDIVDAEQLLLVRVHMPKGKAHAFHRHPHMEEIIYILEGKAEQWVDREKRILSPGDIAHIPRDVVHGTYNVGTGVLRFLAVLGPAKFKGPALVDMSQEEPWASMRDSTGRRPSAKKARRGTTSRRPATRRAARKKTAAASRSAARRRTRGSARR